MKNIFLALLLLSGSIGYSQIKPSAKDSTTLIDTLETVVPQAVDSATSLNSSEAPSTRRPRRLSPAIDVRSVDGIFLGLSYKLQMRKEKTLQKLSVVKSLRTQATIIDYRAEWPGVFKNTDVLISSMADLRGNIINFFGRGNETPFDQSTDFRVYYRVNFSLLQLDPALRFHLNKRASLTAGPSVQHFVYTSGTNDTRFINTLPDKIPHQHLQRTKTHGGIVVNLVHTNRDNEHSPSRGYHFHLRTHAYTGLNQYSSSFIQFFPQLSWYQKLNSSATLVFAQRLGGGMTFGKPAFYQSAFLGSQDNLLGYRKFRFSGDHLLYNNLEIRANLIKRLHSKLAGRAGIIGFYDLGRVFVESENSKRIHPGYGGGVFVSPMNRILLRVLAGFSTEGFQATAAVRQRF